MTTKNVYVTGEVPLLGSGIKTLFGMPSCPDINKLDADVGFLGIPYDYGSPQWVQVGTRHGPNGIRQARSPYNYFDAHEAKSASGWFNVEDGRVELENVTMADCGDVYMEPWEGLKNLDRATEVVRKIVAKGAFPLVVGGDHTITYPVVRGLDAFPSIDIVHFDAHLDFEDCGPERVDNTTPLRRSSELPFVRNITQIGARSPFPMRSKRAYEEALEYGEKVITVRQFREMGVEAVVEEIPKADFIYITFDLDCLDPTIAMGTSTPMPSGFYLDEVVDTIRGVATRGKVVGMDLVEFSPDFDVSNITARTSADLLLYALSAFFTGHQR